MSSLSKGVFVTIGESCGEIWRVRAQGGEIDLQKTASNKDQEGSLKGELKTWPKVLLDDSSTESGPMGKPRSQGCRLST